MSTENDFTIGIGADFKGFLGAIKQAKGGLDSLGKDASRALKTPQADLESLSRQLNTFASVAKGAVAGLAGGLGIKALTTDFMNFHTNLANAVQVMGYDVSEVEAIGGAMRRFGGDTSGAISSLNNLSSALQQAKWGGGTLVETAQKYGISFMKANGQIMGSEELLRSLSKQLNSYDAYTKRAIASSLGLDDALLRVIDTGDFTNLVNHQKKLNKTTNEDLKVATQFESAWLDLKDTMASFAKQVSVTILPPLTSLIKHVVDIMGAFNNFKSKAVITWGVLGISIVPVITKMLSFGKAVKGVAGAFGLLGSAQGVIKGIGGALKSIFSPLTLLVGLFKVFYDIAEDLYVYSKGGDSMFGELEKQFPMLEGLGSGIKAAFEHISKTFDSIVNFFKDPSWANFMAILDPQIELIKGAFQGLIDWLGGLFSGLWESVSEGFTSLVTDPIGTLTNLGGKAIDKVSSGWSWAKEGILNNLPSWAPFSRNAPTQPPPVLSQQALTTPSSTTQVTTAQQTNYITVNAPSGEAKEISKAIVKEAKDSNMTPFFNHQ